MLTRPSAVAGSFYPADAQQLYGVINALLAGVKAGYSTTKPKALIVPHAGYIYSGATAASAYHLLGQYKNSFSRVLLVGPSHRVATHYIAAPSAQFFATPLGDISLDADSIATLSDTGDVVIDDNAHRWEHSLEVELPFLQQTLSSFTLLPLTVSARAETGLRKILSHYWQDPHTLLVISSDLSHFLDYHDARIRDLQTCDQILKLESGLTPEQACGCVAINSLLPLVREKQGNIELLDYRNSGDTAGDKHRVVGYAAFAVHNDGL